MFSTERTPEAAMSLSDEYSPDDLAKLLIERCGSADAAEEFIQSTLAAVRPQGKGDGGDGGGDGGTPALLSTQKKKKRAIVVSSAAEEPADSTMVAEEHNFTLQQLEMIKAKVHHEMATHPTCPPPTAPPARARALCAPVPYASSRCPLATRLAARRRCSP